MQDPYTPVVDRLYKEWPVIQAAPYSFFVSVLVVGVLIGTVIWFVFRNRIDRYKETVDHLERDVERLEKENLALKNQPAISKIDVTASPTVKKKVIHLRALDPVLRLVSVDEDYQFWLKGKPTGRAILLPLYFDPERSDPGTFMESTSVCLVVADKGGKEFQVSHAVWIAPSKFGLIDMSPGETRYLVLVLVDEDKMSAALLSTNITDSGWHYRKDVEEPLDVKAIELGCYDVTAVVSWRGGGRDVMKLSLDLAALSEGLP